MARPDRSRLAVLAGPDGSLSPADIARSADGLVDIMFVLDDSDCRPLARSLRTVAEALAPTITVDFTDIDVCAAALRREGAAAVITFTDQLCLVTALLNAEITGIRTLVPRWGRKDAQRQELRQAGLSRIRSERIGDERSLRDFARSAGLPIVVKPVSGSASRDTWLLSGEPDIREFLRECRAGRNRGDLFAERFIVGDTPPAPHLGDYVSVEVFRSGPAWREAGRGRSLAFVTDRLHPEWPCRETGLSAPSSWSPEQQDSLITATGRALDAVGATTGAFHVEIKPAQPSPEVIEVNGRLGGFIVPLVRYGTGTDLGRLALNCALDADEGLDLQWNRCVIVLFFQPPARAARITRVPSRREIMRRRGVLSVDELCAVGTAVDWREGTNYSAARIWITADDHTELRARLLDLATYLTDEFSYVDNSGRAVQDQAWLQRLTREPEVGGTR